MNRLSKIAWGVIPGLFCALAIYPVSMLALGSFSDAAPGEAGHFTVQNYLDVLADRRLLSIIGTSAGLALASSAGSVGMGVFLAWLVARTDIPFKRVIEVIAVLPFFFPSLLLAIGWAVLANPDNGIVNQLWFAVAGSDEPIVNVYSFWGLAFVMSQHPVGFVYLLAIAPFRNLDADMEHAARMSGATHLQVFRHIQLPLLSIALVPAVFYAALRAFEAFETPLILGTPARVMVFTNEIYYRLKEATPPEYGWTLALSSLLTCLVVLAVLAQLYATRSRSYVTVSGKAFRRQDIVLGGWRWPCLFMVAWYAITSTLLPLGIIALSSFFRSFAIFDAASLTISNYLIVLSDGVVQRAAVNTLALMIVAASVCVVGATFVAYSLKRRIPAARAPVTIMIMTPWVMPGLVLGLAILWAYIRVPGLYGSLYGIGLGYITIGMAVALTSISANIEQLDADLEDAAFMHGASLWQTIRRITVPLLWPGMAAAWFVLASLFSRELAMSSLLYGYGSEVLSVTVLGFWEQGRGNYVAVVSVIFMVLIVTLFTAERTLSAKTQV